MAIKKSNFVCVYICEILANMTQVSDVAPVFYTKGETITRVNGDVSINCSKRLQN
jgi:hypothetical protein